MIFVTLFEFLFVLRGKLFYGCFVELHLNLLLALYLVLVFWNLLVYFWVYCKCMIVQLILSMLFLLCLLFDCLLNFGFTDVLIYVIADSLLERFVFVGLFVVGICVFWFWVCFCFVWNCLWVYFIFIWVYEVDLFGYLMWYLSL